MVVKKLTCYDTQDSEYQYHGGEKVDLLLKLQQTPCVLENLAWCVPTCCCYIPTASIRYSPSLVQIVTPPVRTVVYTTTLQVCLDNIPETPLCLVVKRFQFVLHTLLNLVSDRFFIIVMNTNTHDDDEDGEEDQDDNVEERFIV